MCKKVRNFVILDVKCYKIIKFLSFRVQGIGKCRHIGIGRMKYSSVFEFVYARKLAMTPYSERKAERFDGF